MEIDQDGAPLRMVVGSTWKAISLSRRPWRVDRHWWRGADSISRMYFRVAPEDGAALTIYCDLKTGLWWRQEF